MSELHARATFGELYKSEASPSVLEGFGVLSSVSVPASQSAREAQPSQASQLSSQAGQARQLFPSDEYANWPAGGLAGGILSTSRRPMSMTISSGNGTRSGVYFFIRQKVVRGGLLYRFLGKYTAKLTSQFAV